MADQDEHPAPEPVYPADPEPMPEPPEPQIIKKSVDDGDIFFG